MYKRHAPGVLQLRCGHLQDHAVDELDRGGPQREYLRYRFEGREQIGEVHDRQHGVPGLGDQPHGCFGDHAERALRAYEQADEVTRIAPQRVEVVPADPAQQVGKPPRDLIVIVLHDCRHGIEELPLPAASRRPRRRPAIPPQAQLGAVNQQHPELLHVVHHLAVDNGAGAAGVVPHHPAQCGAVAGGGVWTQTQSVRSAGQVEVVLHDAGLHSGLPRGGIERLDPVHVLGAIKDDRPPDRLPGQTRAPAPREDGRAGVRGNPQHRGDVAFINGNDNPKREDLIDAGVGAVEYAGVVVETHVALHLGP